MKQIFTKDKFKRTLTSVDGRERVLRPVEYLWLHTDSPTVRQTPGPAVFTLANSDPVRPKSTFMTEVQIYHKGASSLLPKSN